MTSVIALHSQRGGVGKTLIAVNLALAYARLGVDTCLIDLDFRAPNHSSLFKASSTRMWINDFLDGRGEIWDALFDATSRYGTDGRLLMGLADPSLGAVKGMVAKDRQWETRALRRLIKVKRDLAQKGVTRVLLDTSPGMLYSSVNAVASSDLVLAVTTADALAVREADRVITELYEAFEKPTYVLVNKATPALQHDERAAERVKEKLTPMLSTPILSVIPCYCDLLNTESKLYALERPRHAFTRAIFDTAEKLSKIIQRL